MLHQELPPLYHSKHRDKLATSYERWFYVEIKQFKKFFRIFSPHYNILYGRPFYRSPRTWCILIQFKTAAAKCNKYKKTVQFGAEEF